MILTRLLSLIELEYSRIPDYVIVELVNEMRSHFRPVEDHTTLKIQIEGSFLKLTMELPLETEEK